MIKTLHRRLAEGFRELVPFLVLFYLTLIPTDTEYPVDSFSL